MHPSVSAAIKRGRQGRLVGLVLAGPFLIAAAAAPIAAMGLGAPASLAVSCLLLVSGWLIALGVAVSGRSRLAEWLALALGAAAIGSLVAAGGGFASPLTVLLIALPVEARWVAGTKKAALAGLIAAAGAALLSTTLSATALDGSAHASFVWQWIVPLVYAVTLWPRLGALGGSVDDSERRETSALEDVIGAVVLRMTKGGDVVAASSQSSEMLGLPHDMLLGSCFFERIHLADRVAYLSALADLRRGAARRDVEMRLREASVGEGEPAAYKAFHAELIADRIGNGLIVVLREDARMVELKAALAAETERCGRSEVTRTRVLAAVSHELRTPLNAILGFSDVLANEMFGSFRNQRQAEYVGLIRDAGGHLLSVVNALLDLSKIESGVLDLSPEAFSFQDAAALCRSMIADQAEAKSVHVAFSDADVDNVYCDRRILQQILINLLSNAVKFTPQGGTVTVSARREGGRLDFDVSDTGIGMAREDLERVGTPFVQIPNDCARAREGAGLGLSLVKGLVGLQGGRMSIESAPDAGTSVRISLPVAAPLTAGERGDDHADSDDTDGNRDALRKTA